MTQSHYPLLKAALIKEFNAPELIYAKEQNLHEIKQGNDTLNEYFTKLERLTTNLKVDDKMKLQIMIQGLNDSYKRYIKMKQPKTYGAATRMLQLKEAVSPPEESNAMKTVLSKLDELTIKKNENTPQRYLPRWHQRPRHTQYRPQFNPRRFNSNNNYNPRTFNQRYRNNPRNGQGRPMNQISMTKPANGETRNCFNCGKKGHLAKTCRAPKKQEQQTTNAIVCFKCGKPGHKSPECYSNVPPPYETKEKSSK